MTDRPDRPDYGALIPKVIFSFQENTEASDAISDFCTRGLLIPGEFLEYYTTVPNMDAYYIHTKNGLRFSISGPEVAQWAYRRGIKNPCGADREAELE